MVPAEGLETCCFRSADVFVVAILVEKTAEESLKTCLISDEPLCQSRLIVTCTLRSCLVGVATDFAITSMQVISSLLLVQDLDSLEGSLLPLESTVLRPIVTLSHDLGKHSSLSGTAFSFPKQLESALG